MGRKANPRGRDRTRTIQLDGDVAEIAQKLAEQSKLSATLSELLRYNYGFGDAIEEKKRQLSAVLDQQRVLKESEEELIAEIDSMETKAIEQNTTVKPALEKRRKILRERLAKTEQKLMVAFEHNEISRLHNVALEIQNLIKSVDQELEALE